MTRASAKRAFDVAASVAGLALISPVLAGIGLLLACSRGGAVLYRQERIGRFGRPFTMLKFRTMVAADRPAGPRLTVGHDARITRLGRWLRRSKLDELPQLVNVVRGEMSLVGPRPEVAEFVGRYTPEQRRVLDLIPGITDVASIAFREESRILGAVADPVAFYVDEVMPEKIRLNLEYAASATLGTDLRVILATFRVWPPPRSVSLARDRFSRPIATSNRTP